MSKISGIGDLLLNRNFLSANEKEIDEFKIFYKTYLMGIKNRNQILAELYPVSRKFYEKNLSDYAWINKEIVDLKLQAKDILTRYFNAGVVSMYEKELPLLSKPGKRADMVADSFWLSLLGTFADAFEEIKEKSKQEWNYKRNFIIFLNNCLANYGLHANILKRDPAAFKRFNLLVTHYHRSRQPRTVTMHFLTYEQFCDNFLKLYLDKKPIKFGGMLIPFAKIHEVKITTSLLKEDELPLFALKNGFKWNGTPNSIERFINCCLDETETYHPNPFDPTSYGREINVLLIEQAKNFLSLHPAAAKLYATAIEKFDKKLYERNVLDDLRLSLEILLKQILGNNKSLENQLDSLGKFQKHKGASKEITNMFQKILSYYSDYQNTYVKHNDNINADELEFMINLTSTLMRFIMK